MCIHNDDPDAVQLAVTEEDQQVILDMHNSIRTNVQPSAANMRKMYWDDKLAVIASKWARVCKPGHDALKSRQVPGYRVSIGQNYASGFGNWAGAITMWYDESALYKYGEIPNEYLGEGNWTLVAHYTQLVRSTSPRLGCGKAMCPELGTVYVCNYAIGNPLHLGMPYQLGDPCSACPDSCSNNLCDCGDKLCRNHGDMDPNTCQCTCNDRFIGDICEIPVCEGADGRVCAGVKKSDCIYSNVVNTCPYKCRICPGNQ